jgi:hypothetical protein
MNSWIDPRVRRIVELELEITDAVSKGHKATDNDKFKEHREELKKLRDELKFERRAQGRR